MRGQCIVVNNLLCVVVQSIVVNNLLCVVVQCIVVNNLLCVVVQSIVVNNLLCVVSLLSITSFPESFFFFQIIARAFNGDVEMTVVWKPQGSESLCDNKWHRVNVVKSTTTLSLQIDSGASMRTKSKGAQTITNTYHPLYVGGVPSKLLCTILLVIHKHF